MGTYSCLPTQVVWRVGAFDSGLDTYNVGRKSNLQAYICTFSIVCTSAMTPLLVPISRHCIDILRAFG